MSKQAIEQKYAIERNKYLAGDVVKKLMVDLPPVGGNYAQEGSGAGWGSPKEPLPYLRWVMCKVTATGPEGYGDFSLKWARDSIEKSMPAYTPSGGGC